MAAVSAAVVAVAAADVAAARPSHRPQLGLVHLAPIHLPLSLGQPSHQAYSHSRMTALPSPQPGEFLRGA